MSAPQAQSRQDGASARTEVVFDLDAAAFSSDEFRMFKFKVSRCPRARPHDWTQCPFAHPGEKAKRRDPRRYRYSGTACPEFRRNGCCRRGDACPFAHGVFECWLHPSRYRTQMCTDGTSCKRRVCFFAHTDNELRKPEEEPAWLQQQLASELMQEQQAQQQLQAFKVLSNLLGGTGSGAGSIPSTSSTACDASNVAGAGLPAGAADLLKLLGLSGSPGNSQGGAPPQPQPQLGAVALEDKLRALMAQLSGGAPAPAAAPAAPASQQQQLLQLLSMLDGGKGVPPALQPPPAAPVQNGGAAAHIAAALLAGMAGGGTGSGQGSNASNASDLAKLAQLLGAASSAGGAPGQPGGVAGSGSDPLQARLAQLSSVKVDGQQGGSTGSSSGGGGVPKASGGGMEAAMGVLSMLGAADARGAGGSASLAAALQQLGMGVSGAGGLDLAAALGLGPGNPQEAERGGASGQDGLASLLAAALNNVVGSGADMGPGSSAASHHGLLPTVPEPHTAGYDVGGMDAGLAALLQQTGLMGGGGVAQQQQQQPQAPPQGPGGSAAATPTARNLQQRASSSGSGSGLEATAASAVGQQGGPVGQGGDGSGAGAGGANLNALLLDLLIKQQLGGGGGGSAANSAAAQVLLGLGGGQLPGGLGGGMGDDLLARAASFDKILSELPRGLGELTAGGGLHQELSAAGMAAAVGGGGGHGAQ